MKTLILFILLIFSGIISCFGQASYQLDKDTSKFKDRPLYVLKRALRDPLITGNLVINVNDIDSINVIKNPVSVTLYGETASNGVVEVVLKNRVALVNYDQLLSAFKIAYPNSSLPVFIDSTIAFRPKNSWFELSAIKSVKIDTEKETGMSYINIRTTSPIDRKAIHIRGNVIGMKIDN